MRISKYQMLGTEQVLYVSKTSTILTAQWQYGVDAVMVWVLTNPNSYDTSARKVVSFVDGEEIPVPGPSLRYVATVQVPTTGITQHIFEESA